MPAPVDPRVSHAAGLAAALAAVIGSWQLLCAPASWKLVTARSAAGDLRRQVAETEARLQEAGGEAAWLARYQQLLRELERLIPSSQQVPALLNRLAEEARGSALTLVNITQGNLEPVTDAGQRPVALSGIPCRSLPVTVTVEGGFRQVVAFLDRVVSHDFPGLVVVKEVQMRTKTALSPTVHASLQLAIYVVGP